MIIKLKNTVTDQKATEIAKELSAFIVKNGSTNNVLVTPSKLKVVDEKIADLVDASWAFNDDIQLASRSYIQETREIKISENIAIGGKTNNTLVITGPCSVESEEQIEQAAQLCVKMGVKVLRAGCFKPRTSPYTFQGLGLEGLKLLDKMRSKYGLKIISEIKDSTHTSEILEYADIIQVGAKAMYDHGILRACSKTNKTVLIKRGFGSTLQEFVQAAEFVLSGGNNNVILCERGIRTFETKTRFTLDLCGVAYLKEYVNLPIVVDPSHAIGYAYGVADLSRAAVAMGVDGLLIETHPNPAVAKSDASQQLNFDEFTAMYNTFAPIAKAVGRNII
ncbi:MAG: bifunctional 3-deoxy-7-phosphoheptulonate synthase/chorismate mutase [Bacteroidetes bacterium]|nr:bifunctional 3-deoxy-7-phosphoheptulonate synthase/chorismate mutase [Bacteroidota bacterium]